MLNEEQKRRLIEVARQAVMAAATINTSSSAYSTVVNPASSVHSCLSVRNIFGPPSLICMCGWADASTIGGIGSLREFLDNWSV